MRPETARAMMQDDGKPIGKYESSVNPPPPKCVDCAHCVPETASSLPRCGLTERVDPVSGLTVFVDLCAWQRDSLHPLFCGPDARFFEEKLPAMPLPVDCPEAVRRVPEFHAKPPEEDVPF